MEMYTELERKGKRNTERQGKHREQCLWREELVTNNLEVKNPNDYRARLVSDRRKEEAEWMDWGGAKRPVEEGATAGSQPSAAMGKCKPSTLDLQLWKRGMEIEIFM